MSSSGLLVINLRTNAPGQSWGRVSPWDGCLVLLRTECPVCGAVPVSTLPCNPCRVKNATSAQKGKDKKAKYDSLQELRKNKKELEFEQKLYKEKEEMLEKEKQLKINRLAQEVGDLLKGQVSPPGMLLGCSPSRSQGTSQSYSPQTEPKGGVSPAPLLSVESEVIPPAQGHLRLASGLDVCLGLRLASLLRYGSEANLSAQIVGLRLALHTPGQRFGSVPSTPTASECESKTRPLPQVWL